MVGSRDPGYSGVRERRGALGNETITFCLRDEVAEGDTGRKTGLQGFGDSIDGDLAGFLAGTGGNGVVGISSNRRCNTWCTSSSCWSRLPFVSWRLWTRSAMGATILSKHDCDLLSIFSTLLGGGGVIPIPLQCMYKE
jgi:hypothetical protein